MRLLVLQCQTKIAIPSWLKVFLKFKILDHNFSTLIKTQMIVYFEFWQSFKDESINRFLYARSLVVSDLRSETKSSGSSSAMSRGGLFAVIAQLICMCLWNRWKWQSGVKVITSSSPPVPWIVNVCERKPRQKNKHFSLVV